MNLLDGWRFSETCSPESEGFQQPIEIGQADDVDHRRAKGHRRADRRIKHPCSNDDRYARFGLNDGNVSARAPFGVQLPDLATMQGVPAVMDFNVLVDMGRMNPRWQKIMVILRIRRGRDLLPITLCTYNSRAFWSGFSSFGCRLRRLSSAAWGTVGEARLSWRTIHGAFGQI